MLGRRLFIYLISLAVMVGAFLWLKSRFFPPTLTTGGHRLKPVNIPPGTGGSNLVMVDRDRSGRLVYVLRFHRAIPKGGGRYHLVKPRMKFYGSHHTAVLVTSDYGDVSVDQIGGPMSNHIYPRKGRLYGHVVITIGPDASFKKGVDIRRKGQFRITVSRPINFNYQQGLITSRGRVIVHGDRIAFAGRRLTCELDVATKRLDYLQIAHGDYLLIRNINAVSSASPSPHATAPSVQTRSSTGGGGKATNKPATTSVGGQSGSSVKKTHPATAISSLSGSVYGLVFTEKVRVGFGHENLSAHRLRLYFSSARSNRSGAGPNPTPTRQPSKSTPSTTLPAATQSAASRTAPPHRVSAAPRQNQSHELIVHWQGPLVLRPVREIHVDLLNVQDVILQAFGRSGDPVTMHDGTTRIAYASEVRYHLATRHLRMKADGLAPIRFVDAHIGNITCRRLLYAANSGLFKLAGPGHWKYSPGASAADPWQGTWQKQMRVRLARNKVTGRSRVKSLRLSGHATFYNAAFHLRSHSMHAVLSQSSGGAVLLRRFVARGRVRMRSVVGSSTRSAHRYDTLSADMVQLSTAVDPATHLRRPSELYAAGTVQLTFHQNGGALGLRSPATAHSSTHAASRVYHLESRFLRAQLETIAARASALHKTSSPSVPATGHFTVGHFHAWGRVSLAISGGSAPITATCSDLQGDRRTKLATLQGDVTSGVPARITEQGNWISGRVIHLNGASENLQIPSAGELYLTDRNGGKVPTHLLVSWRTRMYFRNKADTATFFGHVAAKLVGRPERKSRLNTPVLQVKLAGRKKGALRVSEIYAFARHKKQRVRAEDISYNTAGLIDTRLFLVCRRLRYNARRQHLVIAGSGKISIENYRRKAAPASGAAGPQNRGQSAFAWSKSLDYHGAAGRFVLAGNVRLVYRPMRPFVLSRSIAGAYNGPNKGLILLDAARLIATLQHSDQTDSAAVSLGMGGPAKLRSIRADRAALELSGVRLTADVLAFHTHSQIATAYSAAGRDAHITTPNGKLNAAAREIIWRLGKSSQTAITLIQPRAGGSMP